jgi:hypothetical protein
MEAKLSTAWLDRLTMINTHRSNICTVTVNHNSGPLASAQIGQTQDILLNSYTHLKIFLRYCDPAKGDS